MASLYLGLDSSTQGLAAIVIEVDGERAQVVWQHDLDYDETFPEFGTTHGVLPNDDPLVKVSSPVMWTAALEAMLGHVSRSGLDLTRLCAISGSAQQHGSVYLKADGTLSRDVAPIWMDSSTRDECDEITAALGGPDVLARRTGSRAFQRFTGPQIRKFFETDPHGYAITSRIHLVSSYLASQLIASDAPLDPGDGSGMNLMDLATQDWWPDAVEATAPGLLSRLPRIVPSDSVIGVLAPVWQSRFGFPPSRVVAWTGDNSSSLVGTGLVEGGSRVVSLGTSDTICGLMLDPRVEGARGGHIFGAPTGDFMGITVFKNGSLARERVRDAFGLDWAGFSAALRSRPPGNRGALMFPWFDPEITPDVTVPGIHRVDLDSDDQAGNVRAVVEGQMMAMANHSQWMGADIKVIHATGGAAANRDVLQIMADVFDAEVYQFGVGNSACLGAALRAWHADAAAAGQPVSWEAVVRDLAAPLMDSRVAPHPAAVRAYAGLRQRYASLEIQILRSPVYNLSTNSGGGT
ncbi:MAG TPA: FGGY family carbohydrate kinase [Vicinamibacterales bacterium]|nr:FGGY family carbohydrate kinase [Vicinamibacterales bacterium]